VNDIQIAVLEGLNGFPGFDQQAAIWRDCLERMAR
jgi:hypothetical protein